MAVSGQDTGHKTQDTGTHGHEMSFPKIRTKRYFPKSVSKCYSQNQLRTGYRDTGTRDFISQNQDKTSLPKSGWGRHFSKMTFPKVRTGHRDTETRDVISQNQDKTSFPKTRDKTSFLKNQSKNIISKNQK